MGLPELIIRVGLSFFILFILTRIMGRKEISQMTFFNFVSAIAIGSITASLATMSDLKISFGVIALVLWSVFTVAMGIMDIKSKEARKVIEGEPLVLVKSGKIMEQSLKKTRLSTNSLTAMLRQKNVFSMADVEFAIFETDGKLSVLKKSNKQPATVSDVKGKPKQPNIYSMSTPIISNGIIDQKNLTKLNLDQNWVDQQLKQSGVEDISEIFYGEVQQDGSLYIDKKQDDLQ